MRERNQSVLSRTRTLRSNCFLLFTFTFHLHLLSLFAAENPLAEMFGEDVTRFEPCETNVQSVAGGLFGKCLDRGGFWSRAVAPCAVIDLARPGAMFCWLRVKPGTDVAVFGGKDPGFGNPFQERYPRDYCQACAIGRQMGCTVGIMGYFTAAKPEDLPRLRRQSAGVTLTHELGWWMPDAAKKALADFGYRVKGSGVKVWNYWDEDVPFPVEITGLEWFALAMVRKAVRRSEFKVQSSEFKV